MIQENNIFRSASWTIILLIISTSIFIIGCGDAISGPANANGGGDARSGDATVTNNIVENKIELGVIHVSNGFPFPVKVLVDSRWVGNLYPGQSNTISIIKGTHSVEYLNPYNQPVASRDLEAR
jgi:hypothetical protein